MKLLLREAILRRHDDLQFFQEAYVWRFKAQGNVLSDVVAWRSQEHVPPYVIAYLRHCYEL